MKPFHTAVIVFMGLVLVGCNENDHDDSRNQTPKTSLQGIVLGEDAIQGATVCLDSNDNLQCDPQEIQTKTDTQGKYQLTVDATTNLEYSVIANIPQGTENKTTGQLIEQPYTLTTPLTKHEVISPLTSFVREVMRLHSGMDIATASKIVSYRLKVNDFNLFQDYRKNNSEEGKHIQEIAKSQFILPIEIKADFSNYYSSAVRYTLSKISSNIYFAENDPISSSKYMKYSPIGAIQDEIGFKNNIIPSITAKDLLNSGQLFSLTCITYSECHSGIDERFEYSQINLNNNSGIVSVSDNIYRYNPIDHTSENLPDSSVYSILVNDNWLEVPNAATLSATDKFQSIMLYKIDVSNFSIQSLIDDSLRNSINIGNYFFESTYHERLNPNKKFPPNSYVYKMIRIYNKDFYSLVNIKGRKGIFIDGRTTLNTISELKQHSFNGNTNIIGAIFVLNGVGFSKSTSYGFNPTLVENNSVDLIVNIQNLIDGSSKTEEVEHNRGTWEEIYTPNNKLLKIKINSYRHSSPFKINPFFVEYNNALLGGQWKEAGYVQEDFLFNQAAMDAIKDAIITPAQTP